VEGEEVVSLTEGEEEFLTDNLHAELLQAQECGATAGQMVCAFIAAMALVSDVNLNVKVTYPKPTKVPKKPSKRRSSPKGRPGQP
jgi:hypothetical protein